MSGRRRSQGADPSVRDEDVPGPDKGSTEAWPVWARWAVTGVIVFHFVALLAAALGATPPFSMLERAVANQFVPYYDLIDQGYAYHFYAPEPPPTPVILATVHYTDGRPDETVRIPERGVSPRLRYQRQLALATWLFSDFQEARMQGDGSRSRLAQAYARHLCHTRPGCSSVTMRSQIHRIPALPDIVERLRSHRGEVVDLDAEEFYDVPEWIGDYTCDAF